MIYPVVVGWPEFVPDEVPRPPLLTARMTVGEAHETLWKKIWVDGRPGKKAHCPTCGQLAACYSRPLRAKIVLHFVRLAAGQARTGRPQPLKNVVEGGHVSSSTNSDVSYLRHWGLLDLTGKKGIYHVRPRGFAWIHGAILVPHKMWIFNKIRKGWSSHRVTVDECLDAAGRGEFHQLFPDLPARRRDP